MRFVFHLILALGATPAFSQTYLCVSEASAGAVYNKSTKKWASTEFSSDRKYIVRPRIPEDPFFIAGEYVVQELGGSLIYGCAMNFDHSLLNTCNYLSSSFSVFPSNRKFTHFYIGAHHYTQELIDQMIADGKMPDTPFVEIGSCEKIN